MISIYNEFLDTGFILDKTTQSLSALPYTYDDCKVKTNQYVTSNNFNSSVEKLYNNLMYIYRGCSVGSFEVFYSYLYSISSSRFSPYYKSSIDNYTFNNILTATSSPHLTASKGGVYLPYKKGEDGNYLFFIDNENISCVYTDLVNVKFVFKTTNIDPLSGDIKFKHLTDIKSDKKSVLYVVDNVYNNIYQYNIKNFLEGENIYQEKLFLKNIVGGIGSVTDKNKFNGLYNIAVDENYVVAQDVYNSSFKLYDSNLNWLGTTTLIKIFKKVSKFDAIYLHNSSLYCGVSSNIFKFNLINNSFVFEKEYSLKNYFNGDEYIRGIEKIDSNEQIVYIVTNKSVKKVWLSSLEYVVGEFNYGNNPNRDIKWLASTSYSSSLDILALYSNNGLVDNLSINQDNVYYNSLLNNNNFEIYSKNDCLVKKDEYVQPFVLLKCLEKIYYSTLTLLQNVKYKFAEDVTFPYPVITEKIYNQQFLGFVDNLSYDSNFDIGVNEIFQAEVLNRCIKQIHDLQLILLVYFINNKSSKTYYSPDPGKVNPAIKSFVYFCDESIILTPNPVKLDIFGELYPGGGVLTSLGGAPYRGIEGITIEEGVNI